MTRALVIAVRVGFASLAAGCGPGAANDSGGNTSATGSSTSTSGSSSAPTSNTSSAEEGSADESVGTGMSDCDGLPISGCDFPIAGCMASLHPVSCGTQDIVTDSERDCARFLRDGGAGAVDISFFGPGPEGPGGVPPCDGEYNDAIWTLGDGTAAVVRRGPGGDPVYFGWRRVEVRPPEFFEPCVDTDDVDIMRACLGDWFVPDGCVPWDCCPGPNEGGHPVCE